MSRLDRFLAGTCVAVPLLYFGNLLVSASLYPGYDHVRQYASELGSASATWPAVFNTGAVLTGLAGIGAGVAFFHALRARGHAVLGALAGLCMALAGVSFVFGGVFPMPDPRHGAYGIGMAVYPVPLFLLAGLRREPGLGALKGYLAVSFVLMLGLFAIMMGVGRLVTSSNVGVFQRLFSLTVFPWVGVAGWALYRPARRMTAPRPVSVPA